MTETSMKNKSNMALAKRDYGRKELAISLHNQLTHSVAATAHALFRIKHDRLYEELGFDSFRDYIDGTRMISRTQAYVYCKIAERLIPRLADPKNNDLSCALSGNGLNEEIPGVQELLGLGWKKLEALARLDEEDINELMEGGELKTRDGAMTLIDIMGMASANFTEKLKQYRRDKAKLQEDLKKERAERKILEHEIDDLKQEQEETRLSKRLYGPMVTDIDEKQKGLHECRKRMQEIECIIGRINITMDDPQPLIKDFGDVLDRIYRGYKMMVNYNLWIATTLEEYMVESNFKTRIGQVDEMPEQSAKMDAIHQQKRDEMIETEAEIKDFIARKNNSNKRSTTA